RAGVRGLAPEGDLVALNAEGPEDDAERQAHRLEHRPLLDVQLEVGGRALELTPRLRRAVEVDAVPGHHVRQGLALRVAPLALRAVLVARQLLELAKLGDGTGRFERHRGRA